MSVMDLRENPLGLLSNLHEGLKNPVDYELELKAALVSEGIVAEKLVQQIESYQKDCTKPFTPEERCLLLHDTLTNLWFAASTEAALGSAENFTPAVTTRLEQAEDNEANVIYNRTRGAHGATGADTGVDEKAIGYHTDFHARELRENIRKTLKGKFSQSELIAKLASLFAIYHDAVQGDKTPAQNEILSAIECMNDFLKIAAEEGVPDEITNAMPHLLLKTVVQSTYLTKNQFKPFFMVSDAIQRNYLAENPNDELAGILGFDCETTTPCIHRMMVAISHGDVHRASEKSDQAGQLTRQKSLFEGKFGDETKLHELGLFTLKNAGSIIVVGQNLRMLPELTRLFRDVFKKPGMMDEAAMGRFARIRRASVTGDDSMLAGIQLDNWADLFISMNAWLKGESAFCKGQSPNLLQYVRYLESHGLHDEAEAFKESVDFEVWNKHQLVLEALTEAMSEIQSRYESFINISEVASLTEAEKAGMNSIIKSEMIPLVQQLSWLATHQDGYLDLKEAVVKKAARISLQAAARTVIARKRVLVMKAQQEAAALEAQPPEAQPLEAQPPEAKRVAAAERMLLPAASQVAARRKSLAPVAVRQRQFELPFQGSALRVSRGDGSSALFVDSSRLPPARLGTLKTGEGMGVPTRPAGAPRLARYSAAASTLTTGRRLSVSNVLTGARKELPVEPVAGVKAGTNDKRRGRGYLEMPSRLHSLTPFQAAAVRRRSAGAVNRRRTSRAAAGSLPPVGGAAPTPKP